MKEIIVVTNFLLFGGIERVLTVLMNEWIKMGYKVTVLRLEEEFIEGSYNISDKIEIIDIVRTDRRLSHRFKQAFKVARFLNSRKDAVVLALSNTAILTLGIGSPFIKNKIVFSESNAPDVSPVRWRHRFVRDIMFRRADACVFQTTNAQEHFCRSVQKRSVVIPNPISDDLPEPYCDERRKSIVAVCRLQLQKNPSMTIRAFAELSHDYPDYILEIYGSGELEQELQDLIDRSGLRDKAFLRGFCTNVYEKMNSAAVYVSSSNYEGLSNSMLEALGMGVPTVCTDCPCGGAGAFIKDGENGLLVPVGDVDALYHAIKRILDDPGLADKMSKNACKIRGELSAEKIAAEWLDVLK